MRKMVTLVVAHLTLILGASAQVAVPAKPAQGYPLWGDLKPGPYAVGFRVIQTYDYTRNYIPKVDFAGERATGETARPMQICIWYPAQAAGSAKRMTIEDYVALSGNELGVDAGSAERRAHIEKEFRLGPIAPFFPNGVSDADWARIRAIPTAAVRDAKPAAGKFPVAVHAMLGRMAQSVLLEFLASHGYVIAAVPSVGRSAAFWNRGEWSLTSVEAMMGDLAFVLGEALRQPFADGSRVAFIGGATTPALLYQMRSMRADAIAGIEGDVIEGHPAWDPARVRVPLLEISSKDAPPSPTLLEGLKYAPRYLYRFPNQSHADSYPFRRFAQPERAAEQRTYSWSCLLVLQFLNATLKADASAAQKLRATEQLGIDAGEVVARFIEASAPVATEDEFLTLIRRNQMDEAARVLSEVKQRDPNHRIATLDSMRTVCVFLRRDHGLPAAIAGYKMMLEVFPASGGAHSEIANLYAAAGDRPMALEHYQRSLDLLEKDTTIEESAKAPVREMIKQQMERLRQT